MNGRPGGLRRQRNFALFWTGESISEVGNSVTVIVVPLVAIDTLQDSRSDPRAFATAGFSAAVAMPPTVAMA